MKLIVDYVTIELSFNFDDLQKENDKLKNQVENVKNSVCRTKNCEARIHRLLNDLHGSTSGITSVLSSLKEEQHSRHRRWNILGSGLKFITGVLDADDGENINSQINNINTDKNRITMKVESMQNRLNALQAIVDELYAIEQISLGVQLFSEKIKSLLRTIITKKLDGDIVNLRDVEEKIELAKANIDGSKCEIAFDAMTV